MKPNCYECKWREDLLGDAHSCCKHPTNNTTLNNSVLQIISILASVQRTDPIQVKTGLHIKGNEHGIRNGWFNWPFNFDPIWLDECDGFTVKDKE